jgi:hypothetical protein
MSYNDRTKDVIKINVFTGWTSGAFEHKPAVSPSIYLFWRHKLFNSQG